MYKNRIKLVILLAIILLLVGCGKEVPINNSKSDLVLAIGSEPDGGFDPCTGWGRYGSPLFQSTLINTDNNMGIVYDLATEYIISNDGLTWTFKLREDANFTDGERVTANDVAFTFETAKKSGSIVDLTNMDKATALDDITVEYKLKKPDLAFIYTIAATGIVPEHAYGANYGDNPIGSGPFLLVQWDKGQQIIMLANENYYDKVPKIKKVTILFMEEDAAFAAAKSGQLDVASISPNLADKNLDGMNLINIKTIDNRGLTLPYLRDDGKTDANGNQLGNNVTSDIAIRRALSFGIDRDALVQDVLNGYGRPAFTECDDMPWANSDAKVDYSIEKAKALLNESNWIDIDSDGIREKDGVKAEFNLLYNANDSIRQALAMAVALQAEELGIKITVEGTSWDVIDKRMYSEAVLMGWGAQSPTETYLLYHSDNMGKDYYNPEYFSNSTIDNYIDSAMNSLDINESMEFWKNAQWDGNTGLSTQGKSPWVWLVNVDHLYYVKAGLDMGIQKIHPHGHAWPLVANLAHWKWNK